MKERAESKVAQLLAEQDKIELEARRLRAKADDIMARAQAEARKCTQQADQMDYVLSVRATMIDELTALLTEDDIAKV